jgi:hypothetical protein
MVSEQTSSNPVELPQLRTPEEAIPKSILPWNFDDDRARYLGLRCSGFDIMESLRLIDKAKSTLSHWRTDEKFLSLEQDIPNLRKTLGLEFASIEWLRNFRLILEKDKRVLDKSLDSRLPMLQKQDQEYLLKMRSTYNPQQLALLQEMLKSAKGGEGAINLTDMFIRMSKTTETMEIGTRTCGEPQISKVIPARPKITELDKIVEDEDTEDAQFGVEGAPSNEVNDASSQDND